MNRIEITKGIPKINEKLVISGRELGQKQRKIYKLDELDCDDNKYTIIIPENIVSVAASFFLGVFGKSVRHLVTRENFYNKYNFECNNNVLKNIEDGIYDALNDTNFSKIESGRR